MYLFNRREKFIGITLIILVALLIACGIGSKGTDGKWFKNADLKTWFDSWGKGTAIVQPADETPADQNNSGTTITDNTQNNGTDTTNNGTNTENNNGENANNGSNTENNNGSAAETNNGSTATENETENNAEPEVIYNLTCLSSALSADEVTAALNGASVPYVSAYGISSSYINGRPESGVTYTAIWDDDVTENISDYVVCYPTADTADCLVLVMQNLNGKHFHVAVADTHDNYVVLNF